jgi:hypothetical protein
MMPLLKTFSAEGGATATVSVEECSRVNSRQ